MSDSYDPRVLFAAERTLLAWNRTSISLMAFGFVVERFGLFLEIVGRDELHIFQRHISFFVGISFVLLSATIALYSIWHHIRILKTIPSSDIPAGYNVGAGMIVNAIVGFLAIAVSFYLAHGFI
jgi:putative membrane protein